MMDCNMYHPVMMTKLLLAQLKARKGRAALLVNSSSASLKYFPAGTTYSASKAFITSFTEGLAIECRSTNIDV